MSEEFRMALPRHEVSELSQMKRHPEADRESDGAVRGLSVIRYREGDGADGERNRVRARGGGREIHKRVFLRNEPIFEHSVLACIILQFKWLCGFIEAMGLEKDPENEPI